jgi:NH3-dependent NAD+ synthetase
LDKVLELLIEKGRSTREIVAEGFEEKTVRWIAGAVRKAEYKRRQAAPGLKVTPKAFGVGRRFPLAAEYKC